MIESRPLNKQETWFLYLSLVFLVIAYFINLGIYPLFQEEPRRAIIALEMILNDNYWVPTQTGELYFRKPPIYNWLIIASFKLFGNYSEFAVRFFSVFSQILVGLITYLFTRKYLNHQIAILAGMGFLVSGDILLSASMLGEIDLFYTLITALSIFLIYDLAESKRYNLMFQLVYILTAIGLLTKGLSSLPFTAISLLVYFIMKRQFLVLLSLRHFAGIATFVILSGSYFYMYSTFQDPTAWWSTLINESANKATGGGFIKFITHFWEFPLQSFANLLPAGLFLFLFFKKGALAKARSNPFVWYVTLVFIFNFLIYWFSIEGRARYIYPIFPFIIIAGVYLAYQMEAPKWQLLLKVICYLSMIILTIAAPLALFEDSLSVIDNLGIVMAIIILIAIVFWYLLLKSRVMPILILYGLMAVAKFGFSNTVTVMRQKETGAAEDKALAYDMAEITGEEPIHRYKDIRISYTIVYYLELEKWDILRNTTKQQEGYYLVYESDLKDFDAYEKLRKFYYQNKISMFLIYNKTN